MPRTTKEDDFFNFSFDKAETIPEIAVPVACGNMNDKIQFELKNYQAASECERSFTLLRCGHYSVARVLTEEDSEARVGDLKKGLGVSQSQDVFMRKVYSSGDRVNGMTQNEDVAVVAERSLKRYRDGRLKTEIHRMYKVCF